MKLLSFALLTPQVYRHAIPVMSEGDTTKNSAIYTWSYRKPSVNLVKVLVSTNGDPYDANIELWQSGNVPFKIRTCAKDGHLRPFHTIIDTPNRFNTIAVRDFGRLNATYPFFKTSLPIKETKVRPRVKVDTFEGHCARRYYIGPDVDRIKLCLQTDGSPLNARIEVRQDDENQQIVQLYTENGKERNFYCILQTPGSGNSIRVINTSPKSIMSSVFE